MRFNPYQLLLGIILNGFMLRAQTNVETNPGYHIGFNAGSGICYRTLAINDNSSLNKDALNQLKRSRNQNEIPKLGFSFALILNGKVNARWNCETGIQFSDLGYRSISLSGGFSNITDTGKGFTQPSFEPSKKPVKEVNWDYSHYYIGIPLRLMYNTGEHKYRFIASFGIIPAILLESSLKSITKYTDGTKDKIKSEALEKYNSFNLFPTIGIGMKYSINRDSYFQIETRASAGCLKIINTPLTAYLWDTGLNIGIFLSID